MTLVKLWWCDLLWEQVVLIVFSNQQLCSHLQLILYCLHSFWSTQVPALFIICTYHGCIAVPQFVSGIWNLTLVSSDCVRHDTLSSCVHDIRLNLSIQERVFWVYMGDWFVLCACLARCTTFAYNFPGRINLRCSQNRIYPHSAKNLLIMSYLINIRRKPVVILLTGIIQWKQQTHNLNLL